MFPEIHVVFVMYRFLNIYISEPNHKVSNLKNELLKKINSSPTLQHNSQVRTSGFFKAGILCLFTFIKSFHPYCVLSKGYTVM